MMGWWRDKQIAAAEQRAEIAEAKAGKTFRRSRKHIRRAKAERARAERLKAKGA